MIAIEREAHHPSLAERFADDPTPPKDLTSVEAMRHRLHTKEGKARYALRKQAPKPVFDIIKPVLGSASSCCAASTACAASGAS